MSSFHDSECSDNNIYLSSVFEPSLDLIKPKRSLGINRGGYDANGYRTSFVNPSGQTNTEVAPKQINPRSGCSELQCCWCGKWFRGGQALGGHIRVHKNEHDYPNMPRSYDRNRTLGKGSGSGSRSGSRSGGSSGSRSGIGNEIGIGNGGAHIETRLGRGETRKSSRRKVANRQFVNTRLELFEVSKLLNREYSSAISHIC